MESRVGIVGLGLMGSAFASNLLSRGYPFMSTTGRAQKAAPLVAKGAILHSTAKDLATSVDIVMTSLTDQDAIDNVALGEGGFLRSMREGSLWIDLSTIDPDASVRHAEAAKEAGVDRLDAPVVGSEDLASKGELIILVGGSDDVFRKYQDFLEELGTRSSYLGKDGNGHKMKLDVNLYLGLIGESFSEAFVLSQKQGFDKEAFADVINKTPHRNAFSLGKGPKIAAGDFDAAFSLKNLLKDLRLADEQANETGARLPMSKVALAEYSKAEQSGEGGKDFSIIALVLERENELS